MLDVATEVIVDDKLVDYYEDMNKEHDYVAEPIRIHRLQQETWHEPSFGEMQTIVEAASYQIHLAEQISRNKEV